MITCFLIIATYVLLCDLKGVNTDEGLRLGIINGGQPFRHDTPPVPWEDVLQTGKPFAYQPLYFLLQRTVMNVAQSHSEVLLKLVNIGFLWLSLQGLLALSVTWRLLPRLFLLGAFSFNAYLLMHVLQIREYILGVTFYIWSSWLVLQLLERKLQRIWWDTAWFTAYGLLLILGFYVQTWVVFVAAAQGLFLVVRRHRDRWRFHAHLALSYLMVVAATLPFLRANHQRVDVGRWGTEGTDLWPQLSNGFHLVLTGHIAGHAAFTEFLFWLWPVFIAAAAIIMMVMARPADPTTADARSAFWHQGLLMILSMTFPFAFQVVYFFRLDNLSVWPRYFVIHYFFVFWLLALAVRYLHALASSGELSLKCRRPLQALVVTAMAMMLGAGVYQTASYYRAPFFDTSLSPTSNWRRLAVEISRVLRPDDVMVVHELINQSSLTFSRPLPNRVLMLTDLERADLDSSKRLVYLESVSSLPQRDALAARMAALGYIHLQEVRLHAPDGQHFIPDWRLLVFQR
ncbi:MAG: hypothetical protein PSV13_04920 [Lacunisphaera sp.]|nr:hypothetical protein [Lacunisphaera sp.]